MESLQLPYWMEESITSSQPSQSSLHNNEEFMLFDDFANDFLVSNNDLLINTPAAKSKTAEQLLFELEQKVENEPTWLHDNHHFTAFEPLSAVDVVPILPATTTTATINTSEFQNEHHESAHVQKKNTEELLDEFNTIFNSKFNTVGLQLTPPTTPPSSPLADQDVLSGVPIIYILTDNSIVQEQFPKIEEPSLLDEDDVSECSMDLIDELVREHSSIILDDDTMSNTGSFSPSSETSDPSYSPRSDSDGSNDSFMSPKSISSFDVAGYDEEWTPTLDKLATKRNLKAAGGPKKEKRPYGRPPHEKKARKKEQNKNAATRYRQKKKQELAVVLTEEEKQIQLNEKLQTKYDDVKREVRFLKKLMKEVLIEKGVLQP